MRSVQLMHEGKKVAEGQTLHGLLGGNRAPANNSVLVCNGEVLMSFNRGAWELRAAGVSALLEEFHGPVFAKERG